MLSLTQWYSGCRVAIPNHRLHRFRYFYSASRFHTSQRHSGCRVAIPNSDYIGLCYFHLVSSSLLFYFFFFFSARYDKKL
ncbi:hypothetical protein Hanom_Chr10g00905421 [Helianthus anomalus]